MTLPVVSVNDLPTSIFNGEPQAKISTNSSVVSVNDLPTVRHKAFLGVA